MPGMKQINVPNAELFPEVSRLLSEGRQVTILARGNSMLPFIRDSIDKVLLTSPEGGIAVGDILLCEVAPGRFVLHRLVGLDGDTLILMGDGNIMGKERCSTSHVIARAAAIIRPDGSGTDCRSRSEMRKALIWHRLLPVRRLLLAVWRRTHRLH